jgi:hypothetical protein
MASSGKTSSPLVAAGIIGWDASAPLILTLLPAGHAPGLYTVGVSIFVRTAAGAGSLSNSVLSWNQIDLGNVTTNTIAAAAPTTTGNKLSVYRTLPSNGQSPILYTLTPAGITGTPVIDISAYALPTALDF